MRLLFLNHNVAWRGGTFYRAYHVGRYLTQLGHSVTLLTISQNRRWGFEHEESDGVHIVHTPDLLSGLGRSGWDPWDTLNRIGHLRGQQWDIIHAWDCRPAVTLPALYARRQSRGVGGKLIIDWADWWGRGGTQTERSSELARFVAPLETFFEETFRTWADGTTVISHALYRRALELGVRQQTMRILVQGCDLKSAGVCDRSAARQRLGVPLSQPLAICVGSLLPTDAILLFDSLDLLFRKMPDCRVVMIGKHGARIRDSLRETERLIETGFVSEAALRDYVAACDVGLIPLADTLASRARWPSRANLFLAAGRAVVINRVGDLPVLLEEKGAALVVGCQPDDVANGCIAVLGDPALRMKFESEARRLARETLAWDVIVDGLEILYEQVRNEQQ